MKMDSQKENGHSSSSTLSSGAGGGCCPSSGAEKIAGRRPRGSGNMAPPPSTTSSGGGGAPAVHPAIRDVNEDTPPDLLEGTMELLVILPSTSTVRTTVERRTPMMDLLIQLGTVNKLNPGDHIVQVRNERGFEQPYKPSTPIGALDTSTIEVVPKNRVNDYIIVKKPSRVANQPFEHTFRLQVHLPRNQLYVMRVSMKTVLHDILKEVCQEKNLDILKYEIRHPGNLDERLPLHGTLGQFGLHEITVVSKNTKISSSVSTADIIALQQTDPGRGNHKGYLDSSFKHSRSSVGDSSVSSGSTGSGRGLSPTQSDDSRSVSPSPFPIHSPPAKLCHRPNSDSSSDLNRHPHVIHSPPVQKSISMSNMFSPAKSVPCSSSPGDDHPPPPPRQKKRAAPLPPPLLKSLTVSCMNTTPLGRDIEEKQDVEGHRLTPKKKEAPRAPLTKSSLTSSATQLNQSNYSHHHQTVHSRHSSGSSTGGFMECVSGLTQNELHARYGYDRQSSAPAMLSRQTTARSASNLTTTSSISNTSLASSSGGGSKKRRAPVPPALLPLLKPQTEIDEEDYSEGTAAASLDDPKPDLSGASSKSELVRGQRQNSVEVEVDVHYRKNSYPTNTPISINTSKDEDHYSSTPVSSLSSPGSYLSASSTPSPLPPSTSETGNCKESKYEGSSLSSPITQSSNFCTGTSEPAASDISMQSPTDDNPGSTQVLPTPLPPPRRAREIAQEIDPNEDPTPQQPQPKPRPKPRPDRKSNEDPTPAPEITATKSKSSSESSGGGEGTSSGEEKTDSETQKPSPVFATQLRNPLSKYGVKVLPDNVLKERADRLAKSASMLDDDDDGETRKKAQQQPIKASNDGGGSISSRNKKSSAPPPPKSSPPSNVKPPLPPSSKNSAFQLRQRESSDSSAPESSSRDNQNQTKAHKSAIPKSRKSKNSLSEDSDNLEENLELFEPQPIATNSKSWSQSNFISFNSPKSSVSLSSGGDPSQSKKPNKAPSPPSLQPEPTKPRVISSSESDFQEMERKSRGSDELRVNEEELARTNSDRFKNKNSAKLSPPEDGKLLNRWQNQESLNELDNNDTTLANVAFNHKTTNKVLTPGAKVEGVNNTSSTSSSTHFNKRSKPSTSSKLSPDDPTLHSVEMNHEEDAGHTSSESEVSYTDSGIPTTETITPSPMDFDARISDHEDDDGESPTKEELSASRGSSNRSSFQSDDGDQWRNVLEKKTQNSHEAQEKTFASMLPQSLNDAHTREEKSHSKNKHESNDYDDIKSSTDDDQKHNQSKEGSRRSSSDSSTARKLSKSESFSHNSEFDFVQMKRKQFAGGRGNPQVVMNLAGSFLHSSSEDDVRFSQPRSNESDDSPPKNPLNSNAGHVIRRNSKDKTESSLQKTTSLHEIQTDSSKPNDPELMKQFHSQLEAQFEQWKTDFLKKQGSDGNGINESNMPTQSNQNQVETSSESNRNHPVMDEVQESTKTDTNSFENTVPTMEVPASSQISVSQRETTQTVQLRKPAPKEYKYTGPPTINMGAWTERPKSTVSVKKDEDYIMGFGQANPKASSESKPHQQGKPLPRHHSFNQNTNSLPAPQRRSPQIISPTFRSVVEAVSPPKIVTTPQQPMTPPTKGLSATINARPASSVDSPDSVSTIKSVLSTWKQRVNNEDLNKNVVPVGHPPEIDIYENEGPNTFTRTSNQKLVHLHEESVKDSAKVVADERKMKIVDGGSNVNITISKSKFDQPSNNKQVMPIEIERPVVISKEPPTTKPNKPIVIQEPIQIKIEDKPDSGRAKPMFKISSMESKPNKILAQVQQSRESGENNNIQPQQPVQPAPPSQKETVALRKSQISLDISFPSENGNGPSLKDRKSYFQGVAPVESPSKEMPLPAVNMKNSIATIQKVFEQRKQQSNSPSPSPTPTLQRSQTLTPTKSEVIVVESEPAKVNPAAAPPPAQHTMPRQFSMMSSSEMVQRVLGKSPKPGFDAFRRSPSPMSSTTSTLSRTSSSGRDTTSSDGGESSVRIANEIKKPISAPSNNIQNVGNKSIIIVQSSEPKPESSSEPAKGSVSNNVFKLQNSINISTEPKKAAFGENAPIKRKSSITTTTIVINGNGNAPSPSEKPSVKERRESWTSGKLPQVSISAGGESERKLSSTGSTPPPPAPPPPMSGGITGAPPPPPPPPDMQFMRPKPVSLNFNGRPKSENFSSSSLSSPSSKRSTPSSPNAGDPRNEIFSAIKNSNGNFGLKKTNSTFLLK